MKIKTYPQLGASNSASSSSSRANLLGLRQEEEDNASICCDIYIDNEEQQDELKGDVKRTLQVQAVLRGIQDSPSPPDGSKQQERSKRGCIKLTLIILAVLALLGIVIGVSVAVVAKQQRQKQPGVVLQPQQPGAAALPAAVTISVPFDAMVSVPPPAGSHDWSCATLFKDAKARERFAARLASAHAHQLAQQQVDEVVVAELQCNGVSFPLPSAAQGLASDAGVAPAGRRLQHQHQQREQAAHTAVVAERAAAGAGRGRPLTVYVQLEAKRREQLEQVPPVSSYVQWIRRVSAAGAAAARALVPRVLEEEFGLAGCEATAVQQLLAEVVSSQVVSEREDGSDGDADDGGAASATSDVAGRQGPARRRRGFRSTTLVVRTFVDPLTGGVVDSQTMHLPGLPELLPDLLPSVPAHRPGGGGSSGTDEDEDEDDGSSGDGGDKACGACSLPNAMARCVDGVCAVQQCMAGWQDCDGSPNNGCEAEVMRFFTDRNHCGSCNRVCLAPLTCQAGMCSAGTVAPPPIRPGQPASREEQPEEEEEQQQQEPEPAAPQQPEQPAAPGQQQEEEEEQQPEEPQQPEQEPEVVPPPATKPTVPEPHVPPPAAKPKPHKPAPKRPAEGLVELRDDVARITPQQDDVVIDVMGNDDLRGIDPAAIKLSLVAPPAAGTVTVLPADGAAAAAGSSSSGGRARLLFKQGQHRLAAGDEVELYYTLAVPGQPTPAPATALVLGAAAPSDAALADSCAPGAAAEVPGTPIPALARADDAAAPVPLPFPVTMYGSTYNNAVVSSNGWVALGGAGGAREPCATDGAWPGAACLGSGPVLAVFWDDLVPDQVLTHHDTQLGAFVIQWTNVMFPSSPLPLGTFQAFLFPNGTVGYAYRDLYGIEQALGTSAVVGIRGPAVHGRTFTAKLNSTALREVGSGADAFDSWLFGAALDDSSSEYVTTLGRHRRFLSPGLAVVSHPTSGVQRSMSKLVPWGVGTAGNTGAGGSAKRGAALPLLVAPGAPPKPVLQPVGKAGPRAGSNGGVATLAWQVPASHAHPATFFKLYLAADPSFNELLRQPEAPAFKPDMPGSSRRAEVVVDGRHAASSQMHALLLACNGAACSRACVSRFSLA